MSQISHVQGSVLSTGRIFLFAMTTGLLVANLYYAQPLLADIAASFGRSSTDLGFLITITQLGYGLGVLLIVPLGDFLDRRKLATSMLLLCCIGLLGAAFSPSFLVLAIASLVFGTAASAAMVIIPYVASHASEDERGRRIGQVMTGLLLGILLARTVSGFVAEWSSWHVIYVLAAVAIAGLWIALRRAMQRDVRPSSQRIRYLSLMSSLWHLLKSEPELRRRSLYALLGLGSFSTLWTGLTFLLSSPPYSYSTEVIGLFGLIGAAGALSANLAGRLGDRGWAERLTGVFALLLLVAWGFLYAGMTSLPMIIIGIFLVDVAGQGLQVTHQSVIYRLAPEARSRITSVFITTGFIGMSLGSALASLTYAAFGWSGVCAVGSLLPLVMLLHWAATKIRKPRL